MQKKLITSLKYSIIESTNIDNFDINQLERVHNIIIKYLDNTFKDIITNNTLNDKFNEVKESIINEICYNSYVLVDYNKFSYLLLAYLNKYYVDEL